MFNMLKKKDLLILLNLLNVEIINFNWNVYSLYQWQQPYDIAFQC